MIEGLRGQFLSPTVKDPFHMVVEVGHGKHQYMKEKKRNQFALIMGSTNTRKRSVRLLRDIKKRLQGRS